MSVGDTDGNRLTLDHEDIWRAMKAESLREYGLRYVENLATFSEDSSQSAWVSNTNSSATATVVTLSVADASFYYKITTATLEPGETVIFSVYLTAGTKSGVQIRASGATNGTGANAANVTMTSEAQRFTVSASNGHSAAQTFIFGFENRSATGASDTTAGNFTVEKWMLESSTGRSDTTTPSEYISTGVGTGAELVVNGTFDTDSDWTKGTGWSIGSGVATFNGVGTDTLRQDCGLVTGQTYLVTYEISGRTTGNMQVVLGGDALGTVRATNGTFTEVIISGTNSIIYFQPTSGFDGSIDNVTAKRIDHGANVDGAKFFTTTNGNSVTNNVVTEGTGSAIAASTLKGLFCEGEAENICLHSRDFTNAAWVKTNITAAKDATGIDAVPNGASTLTASAANGTCFQSVTVASAAFNTSFWVKRKTGTGTIEITDNGGTNYTDITSSINSSTYTQVQINRTQANPNIGFRIVTSGDEIEVDFAGLVDNPYATSPIETTTTSVTRLADVEPTLDLSNWPDGDVSVEFELTPFFDVQLAAIGGIVTSADNAIRIAHFPASASKVIQINDGTIGVTKTSAWTNTGDTVTVKLRANATTSTMNISVDSVSATEAAYDGSFNLSGAITLFKSLTLGGAMKNLKDYPYDKTDAWL